MDRATINHKLKKFYEFDDDDLYANNNGRLTQKQEGMLKGRGGVIRTVGFALGGLFAAIALLVGAFLPFILALAFFFHDWDFSSIILPLIEVAVAFLVTGAISGYIFWRTIRSGKSSGVLRNLTGPLEVRAVQMTSSSKSGSRSYSQYQMKIGDSSEFVLDDELVGIVKAGDEYSINFMDFQIGGEGLILTMEKL